jgi:hypothetical protein
MQKATRRVTGTPLRMEMIRMDDKQFNALMSKLDGLSKLLAFDIIKDRPVNEQIDMLTKAGLKAKDIAEILGRTENQVYVTQNALRKKIRKGDNQGPAVEESTHV